MFRSRRCRLSPGGGGTQAFHRGLAPIPLPQSFAGYYHRHMDLNPAQYDAVHTLSGPLLVLAGAAPERPAL